MSRASLGQQTLPNVRLCKIDPYELIPLKDSIQPLNLTQIGNRMPLQASKLMSIILSALLALSGHLQPSLAEEVLSLTVTPTQGDVVEFGHLTRMRFEIQNNSPRVVIVQHVESLMPGNEALVLSNRVYGSVRKQKDRDAYFLSSMSQSESKLCFHGGMLLPGEKLLASSRYRPVSKQDTFKITYYVATDPYNRTAESTLPLKVYVKDLKETKAAFRAELIKTSEEVKQVKATTEIKQIKEAKEAKQAPWLTGRPIYEIDKLVVRLDPTYYTHVHDSEPIGDLYIPFTKSRWDKITNRRQSIGSLGPNKYPRAVLIPDLPDKSQVFMSTVDLHYEGSPFLHHEAMHAAIRISGKDRRELTLAFSSFFDSYVVFEERCSWLLTSKQQENKGDLLTVFPISILVDLDLSKGVSIKVGEKQEYSNMQNRKPHRLFWEQYPVRYGDGMYTDGEFIGLSQKTILSFLKHAHAKRKALRTYNYFFRSCYYVLADMNEKPTEVQ